MSMQNSDTNFYGKQEGEKILYTVYPHILSLLIKLSKIYSVSFIVFIALFIIGQQISWIGGIFSLMGVVLAFLVVILGTKIVVDYQKRNISYITDRRIVHFEPTTLFATNSRTLSWDEVVKVKTYPPNIFWKQMAIGNVTLHARTPARSTEDGNGYNQQVLTILN